MGVTEVLLEFVHEFYGVDTAVVTPESSSHPSKLSTAASLMKTLSSTAISMWIKL